MLMPLQKLLKGSGRMIFDPILDGNERFLAPGWETLTLKAPSPSVQVRFIVGLTKPGSISPPLSNSIEKSDIAVHRPFTKVLMRGAWMGEWSLSRRDSTIVARHEVPGIMRKIALS